MLTFTHCVSMEARLSVTVGKGFTVTVSVCAEDEPQKLFAVTVIFPPVEFDVVFILLVAEVPLHPPGNVHE